MSRRARAGGLDRAVGVLIAAAVVVAVLLLGFAAVSLYVPVRYDPSVASVGPGAAFLYDLHLPPARAIAVAVAVALLLAAGVATVDQRIAQRYRRSSDVVATPLAPKLVMERTRGVFAGPITITVLVPAHDEEAQLPGTLEALLAQSRRPDRVIVVADNCTDRTVEIARSFGTEVVETVGNREKKAGALNQALRELLPTAGDNDLVMVLDADTRLDDGFLEAAARRFEDDRALMAVGGLFYGEEGAGLLGQFQRNEYHRYAREIRRRRGRVYVLTGTASLFRSGALRTVAEQRGRTIPGTPGNVYDTAALTEDNELTIALKSLGALMVSPASCSVVTEVMPTWGALWTQRLRWQRGALENIGAYGLRPQTMRYWAQQLGIGYSVIALSAFLLLILITVLAVDTWVWFPFWLALGALFTVERVVSVWAGGWRARLLAVLALPELVYDMFLNVVYVKGILDITFGRTATWGHLRRGADAELVGSER